MTKREGLAVGGITSPGIGGASGEQLNQSARPSQRG